MNGKIMTKARIIQLTVFIEGEDYDRLSKLADKQHEEYAYLARRWLLERIKAEWDEDQKARVYDKPLTRGEACRAIHEAILRTSREALASTDGKREVNLATFMDILLEEFEGLAK